MKNPFRRNGRTQEFHLGAVSHQHLLSRGQMIGLSATHHALAHGFSPDEGEYEGHMERADFHGFRSAMMNAHANVIPTSKMKYSLKNKTPGNKVDQN